MIDMYSDYYDFDDTSTSYPIVISWKNPEDGEDRTRILRSEPDSDEFFGWFLRTNPDIKYSVS
jgi:hypothetical protein|tara:strand:- start:188 stop:376 length:189 start_codon:yes stop_codon:yes gene_type:complete